MSFEQDGYKILREIVDTKTLYEYCLQIEKFGNYHDPQVPNTPSFYGDKEMDKLQDSLHERIEWETGLKLFKTYNYFRIYKNGDVLRHHTDRPACEISITLHIGGDADWEIYVMDKDENPIKVMLKPGDLLIYRGIERPHWRPKFTGTKYVQVFMHFVDQNGPYSVYKNDQRVIA